MKGFKKELHDPIKLIKQWWPEANIDHIIYDPNMKGEERDYWRIEQSGGDGTSLFTIEMLQKVLLPLLNKNSFCRTTEPKDWTKVKDMKYTIGKIRHATVFGMIYLKCSENHKYPGQRERVRIPVKCEYIYF